MLSIPFLSQASDHTQDVQKESDHTDVSSGCFKTFAKICDFKSCISWRAGGTNRIVWKSVCTNVLLFEIAVIAYLMWQNSPWVAEYDNATESDTTNNNIPPPPYRPTKTTTVIQFVIITIFSCKSLVEIWGQETPTWICPGTYTMFFVIFGLIVPGFGYTDCYCTKYCNLFLINGSDNAYYSQIILSIFGFFLFLFGSIFSISYEISRFRWKAKPENKGRLHTVGLASYCIHPNYFGDFFTYTGWALVTGTSCALSAPIAMLFTFVFIVIPSSDGYLAKRYAFEFPEYYEKTPTLFPGFFWTGKDAEIPMKILGILAFILSFYVGSQCSQACG